MGMAERGGCDDRNVPERMQHQQIEVAGYDHIRPAIHRQFEKLVIRGIAANGDPFGNCYQLGLGKYSPHFIEVGRQQPGREIGPLQNLDQLMFGCRALE